MYRSGPGRAGPEKEPSRVISTDPVIILHRAGPCRVTNESGPDFQTGPGKKWNPGRLLSEPGRVLLQPVWVIRAGYCRISEGRLCASLLYAHRRFAASVLPRSSARFCTILSLRRCGACVHECSAAAALGRFGIAAFQRFSALSSSSRHIFWR